MERGKELSAKDATWEDAVDFSRHFPSFNLGDKVASIGESNDRIIIRRSSRISKPNRKHAALSQKRSMQEIEANIGDMSTYVMRQGDC